MLYLRAMPNSVNSDKEIFLHVILVRDIISCSKWYASPNIKTS